METMLIGEGAHRVSRLVLGCWQFSGNVWGEVPEADALATLRQAADLGVNFLDTAEAYGDGLSEEIVGKAMAATGRAAFFVASKPKRAEPGKITASCEASLKRLGTDHIDLYQLHWPPAADVLDDCMRELQGLKEAGKVREIGVCNFGTGDLDDLVKQDLPRPVTNQIAYNLLWRAIEDAILPDCRALGIGILAYSPLMQGLLTGKFTSADEVPAGRARSRHFSAEREQARHGGPGHEELTFRTIRELERIAKAAGHELREVALAWLLQRPGVAGVIVGARRPEQVAANAATVGTVELSPETVQALDAASEELRKALGPDPDMWAPESRVRLRES